MTKTNLINELLKLYDNILKNLNIINNSNNNKIKNNSTIKKIITDSKNKIYQCNNNKIYKLYSMVELKKYYSSLLKYKESVIKLMKYYNVSG